MSKILFKTRVLPLYTYQHTLDEAKGFRDAINDMRGDLFFIIERSDPTVRGKETPTHDPQRKPYRHDAVARRLRNFYMQKSELLSQMGHSAKNKIAEFEPSLRING